MLWFVLVKVSILWFWGGLRNVGFNGVFVVFGFCVVCIFFRSVGFVTLRFGGQGWNFALRRGMVFLLCLGFVLCGTCKHLQLFFIVKPYFI